MSHPAVVRDDFTLLIIPFEWLVGERERET
jgi:hypothetical protein